MWIATIEPSFGGTAYVGPGKTVTWNKDHAKHFSTQFDALDAAKDTSFAHEGIGTEELEGWIAFIGDCYLGEDGKPTNYKQDARRFSTKEDALDAATDASDEGDYINALLS